MRTESPLHLTYCLNVHPGERWEDQLSAIRHQATALRDQVADGKPFGLGLRISNQASEELQQPEKLHELKQLLAAENLYVFTINGFPFGQFHGARVKEQVYAPDWRETVRLNYTNRIGGILAELLPDGMDGSISTVPCSFKPWITSPEEVDQMIAQLTGSVMHFAEIEEKTGKEIHLGLEPEPGCFLETTRETIDFFQNQLWQKGTLQLARQMDVSESRADELVRRHLGVCFDTCHAAVQFEDPADAFQQLVKAGVRISKVQLSAALRADGNAGEALRSFCEPVYFHQTIARNDGGSMRFWFDLPEALEEMTHSELPEEWRVHFHVPLFWNPDGPLKSTAALLTPEFFSNLKSGSVNHLEIETYTFHVLPDEIRPAGLVASIASEYAWALQRLRGFA